MKTFKEIRQEKGISLAHVAKALNITTVTLRSKENGQSEFSAPQCKKLCALYGVKFEEVKV